MEYTEDPNVSERTVECRAEVEERIAQKRYQYLKSVTSMDVIGLEPAIDENQRAEEARYSRSLREWLASPKRCV